VQLRLQLLNYLSRNANGNFDRTTTEALARFQRSRGLAGDGVVGQRTWTVLQNAIATSQIRDMQERLRGAGFYRGSIDGRLGTDTQRAIEAATRVYGVSAAAVLRGSY
jgi:peptidoglycan hydrolase-like protein with peptidoglycan-binding domain